MCKHKQTTGMQQLAHGLVLVYSCQCVGHVCPEAYRPAQVSQPTPTPQLKLGARQLHHLIWLVLKLS